MNTGCARPETGHAYSNGLKGSKPSQLGRIPIRDAMPRDTAPRVKTGNYSHENIGVGGSHPAQVGAPNLE